MRNANRVGNDRKTKAPKHQPRASQAHRAGSRKKAGKVPAQTRDSIANSQVRAKVRQFIEKQRKEVDAVVKFLDPIRGLDRETVMLREASESLASEPHRAEPPMRTRDFVAKSIERAVAGQNFEKTLEDLDDLQGMIEHVPGMNREVMMLTGALGLIEVLETVRKPGYCASVAGDRERVFPDATVTLSVRLMPEDIRDLVNGIIQSSHETGATEGRSLAAALEANWPHSDKYPVWSDLLLDAQSVTTEMNLKAWSARLEIVVPALRWSARLNAMAELNGWHVTAPDNRW